MDYLEQLTYDLSSKVSSAKEEILCKAVNHEIGEFQINQELLDRLHSVWHASTETYFLDGKPIAKFYPLEYDVKADGNSYFSTVKFNYWSVCNNDPFTVTRTIFGEMK